MQVLIPYVCLDKFIKTGEGDSKLAIIYLDSATISNMYFQTFLKFSWPHGSFQLYGSGT